MSNGTISSRLLWMNSLRQVIRATFARLSYLVRTRNLGNEGTTRGAMSGALVNADWTTSPPHGTVDASSHAGPPPSDSPWTTIRSAVVLVSSQSYAARESA